MTATPPTATDMFTLLKVDGDWKIISKVFHRRP